MRLVACLAVLALAAPACSLGGAGEPERSPRAASEPAPAPPGPLLSAACAADAAARDGEALALAERRAALAGEARGLRRRLRAARSDVRRARAALDERQAEATAAEAALRAFLATHPEEAVPPDVYAEWQGLRSAYRSAYDGYRAAFREHRRAVRAHNRLVRRGNTVVRRLNRHTRSYGELAREHRRALQRCLAEDEARARVEAAYVERLEARAAEAASTLAGREAEVECSLGEWSQPEDVAGFVREGSAVVHLAPDICYALHRLLVLGDAPDLSCFERSRAARAPVCSLEAGLAGAAVLALAHEAQHVAGIANEARAECYGLQAAGRAAELLGLGAVSPSLAWYGWRHTERPDEYRSPECRRGGKLDLTPETRAWP